MKLKADQKVPDFQVTDLDGNLISPGDRQGRWLLLSFYRYASCPFCNLRVHELEQEQEKLRATGLDLVAVFQSPAEKVKKHAGARNLGFPLVCDPDETLYRLFEVKTSWFGFLGGLFLKMPKMMVAIFKGYFPGSMEGKIARMPADFLIDPDGIIKVAYYGSHLADHLPTQKIGEVMVNHPL